MSNPYEKPVHLSHDDRVGDEDDYLDQMAMDSFPASDPPSTSPAALGTPNRSTQRRPDVARGAGQSATGVTLVQSLGSIVRSSATLMRCRFRELLGRVRA